MLSPRLASAPRSAESGSRRGSGALLGRSGNRQTPGGRPARRGEGLSRIEAPRRSLRSPRCLCAGGQSCSGRLAPGQRRCRCVYRPLRCLERGLPGCRRWRGYRVCDLSGRARRTVSPLARTLRHSVPARARGSRLATGASCWPTSAGGRAVRAAGAVRWRPPRSRDARRRPAARSTIRYAATAAPCPG